MMAPGPRRDPLELLRRGTGIRWQVILDPRHGARRARHIRELHEEDGGACLAGAREIRRRAQEAVEIEHRPGAGRRYRFHRCNSRMPLPYDTPADRGSTGTPSWISR